jgi:transposase
MKTKSKHPVVGQAIGSAVAVPAGPLTVGMDLGDKKHSICVLDATRKVLRRERIPNDRPSLAALCRAWKGATFVMEVGVHSPWISRCMQGLGCRVIVANARKVRAVSNPATERLHQKVREEVPEAMLSVIAPLLAVLEETTARIKEMEAGMTRLIKEHYPAAQRLQQIPGVGPVTSLCFVLKVGNSQRFGAVRDIGAYLGLKPKRDQSGDYDKELGITECGDHTQRRLLVNCAQYNIMGPFGPPGALRACDERLAGSTAQERKRAVIAVAWKLAVVMLSMWKNGSDYEARVPPAEVLAA